jgi:hypothetical protein
LPPQIVEAQAESVLQLALLLVTHSPLSVLHRPVLHAAFMPSLQPMCKPSSTTGDPAAIRSRQVRSARLQYLLPVQSVSAQQRCSPGGMHTPELAHAPDWQTRAAFSAVHGPSPMSWPHRPLPPQIEEAQAMLMMQPALLLATHRPVSALHKPVLQASLMPSTQPMCKPSPGGTAAPAAMRSRHACASRSQ